MLIQRLKKTTSTEKDPTAKSWLKRFPTRYQPLIVVLLSLSLILSVIFAVQYFHSNKHGHLSAQIDTLGKLNTHMRQIWLNADTADSRGNIPRQLDDLYQETKYTHAYFAALQSGGEVNAVKIKTLPESILKSDWQNIVYTWQNYQSELDKDAAAINTGHRGDKAFHNLVIYARHADDKLQDSFDNINNILVKEALIATTINKSASIAGVVLMVISFIILIIYIFRQLHKDDQVLKTAHLEVHEILDTLSEGLFLLHEDFHINMQPSKRLKSLLPQLTENGQNFLALAGEILNNTQKLSATKMFIEQLYNPRVVEKLIHSLNPLDKVEITCPKNPHETRIIGFQFTRIMNGNHIAKVLVSVKDLTDSVRIENRLQREQEQNDLQIEMISKMLNAEESIMRSFLHISLKQLAQINQILKQPNNSSSDLSDKLRLISQEIHAFKGEASMLDMSAFRLAAEAFEDMIKDLHQKKQLSGNDFIPLVTELDSLIEKLAQAEELHRKITGRLNNPIPAPTAASATDLGTILGKFVVNMGYRHNKNVIMETGGLEYLRQENESFPAVKDIIIQILRNAVVHGIEPVRARTLNGKSSEGHIKLNVLPQAGKIRITIEDDGRGIDLDMLRNKALEMKLANAEEIKKWSDNQLFSLIFRPNFSTLPEGENHEDGGRGMGMDVVRSRIKSLNGNIGIQTQAGQYTRFTIVLPFDK
ncbi:ATP-binding protein [Alysiella filiformis]|uniref:Chemotaxis protein CheA n=1 Tax=Alysiella filiformis DSM 16848 TaxID=1120981 RepID=A0A286ECA2_9NEIS|nr:ATP-binding protein [Alysiella filiformis]QMT30580.1 Hpt domain-containing protein [Alysiella filiformis]UBQ56441.1 Hpt domain-containing protein [Alysiella filiformis DSM 16848]SOD68565.1 Hpt domain-containing protein [Alysiella filiformis DSM 16848]